MQLVTHPAFLPHHAPSSCEFATLHTNSLTPLLTGMVKNWALGCAARSRGSRDVGSRNLGPLFGDLLYVIAMSGAPMLVNPLELQTGVLFIMSKGVKSGRT